MISHSYKLYIIVFILVSKSYDFNSQDETLVHKSNFKDTHRIIRKGETSKMLGSKVNTLRKIMIKYQGGNT
jgi:hypothetical protein